MFAQFFRTRLTAKALAALGFALYRRESQGNGNVSTYRKISRPRWVQAYFSHIAEK
jgi:hypothetical protein